MKIFSRLKTAIKEAGFNQKKIAEHFEWPEATVGRILRGEVDPGLSKIEKIADFLNINHTWLFTGRGPMFYPRPDRAVNEPVQPYGVFNPPQESEFRDLALQIIQEEQISQEELVAAVLEVRRRRRPAMPPAEPAAGNLSVEKLKKGD